MTRSLYILLTIPLLAACAAVPKPMASARPQVLPSKPIINVRGLEAVMGKTAPQLIRLFGEPRLDTREATARKLQFRTGACVLDAYLYPPRRSKTPVVTHVDARRSNGAAVDRASCVNALRRK